MPQSSEARKLVSNVRKYTRDKQADTRRNGWKTKPLSDVELDMLFSQGPGYLGDSPAARVAWRAMLRIKQDRRR